MSLKKYGVLKGKATDSVLAPNNEHFQIKIEASGVLHRIAINVKSKLAPPEVLFYMDEDFHHAILQDILDWKYPPLDFHNLIRGPIRSPWILSGGICFLLKT